MAEEKQLAFILHAINDIKFEDRPVPKLTDPHDVLIQVKYTGICGSDVHYWTHGKIGDYILKSPMILGHESSGIVVNTGSSVKSLHKGDKVAMEPGVLCRRCKNCLKGKYNLCDDMKFAATPPYDGTLTKYYVLPEDFCHVLPENVSLGEGAVVEPLSVAVHVVRLADVRPGHTVVVFGAGPVGLLCCAVAKAFGASKIVVVDIVQSRLEFAKNEYKVVTGIFQPTKDGKPEDNAAKIIEENGLVGSGEGADVVIDASGAEPSIITALNVCKKGGVFVQAGMGKDEINGYPVAKVVAKELTYKGSFRYGPGDYATAVGLLADGRISVKELITGMVPFKQAEQAFKNVKEGKGIKTLIKGVDVE